MKTHDAKPFASAGVWRPMATRLRHKTRANENAPALEGAEASSLSWQADWNRPAMRRAIHRDPGQAAEVIGNPL